MLTLRNKTINFLLDTGASVNLMIGKDFDNMEGITLEKQTSSCILLKEKLPLKLKENSKRSLLSTAGELKSEFFVTENSGRNSILSYNT